MQVGIDHSLGKGKYPLVDFLVSRRVASYLLVLFILLSIMGTLIPQEMLTPPEAIEQWQGQYKLLADVAIFWDLPGCLPASGFSPLPFYFSYQFHSAPIGAHEYLLRLKEGGGKGSRYWPRIPRPLPGRINRDRMLAGWHRGITSPRIRCPWQGNDC